jgi:hypothetical protein
MDTVDLYVLDQNKYLDTLQNAHELEHDGKYFWIFRNLDYKKWSDLEVQILVLSGSPILEYAASHIVRTLRHSKPDDLLLHFFYRSTINADFSKLPTSAELDNLVCVFTLLKQAITDHPPAQQQFLLELFLEAILAPMDEESLAQVLEVHENAFAALLGLSTVQDLLRALGRVLNKAAEFNGDNNASERESASRNLTFILDLDNRPVETNSALIDKVRREMESLRRAYPTVRLLVTNPPAGDHGLRQPSEALIEYDKERKGLWSPQPPAALITIKPA